MSLYPTNIKIDGVTCGVQLRGSGNGYYTCIFEREFASLEDIEGINWDSPTITGGETIIPAGYGFEVDNINYDYGTKSYKVTLKVKSQYLGDVTAYVSQVNELEAQVSEKNTQIQQLTAEKTTLENDKANLEAQLEEKNNQISDMTETMNTLQADIATLSANKATTATATEAKSK